MQEKKLQIFIKINKDNIQKITNKDDVIEFKEFNKHNNHKELIDLNNELIDPSKARTEKENINLAIYLIKNNIKEDLDFNFYKNKIFWKKSKISKYIFNIREQKFPKDELFLNFIYTIKIKLAHNEFTEENFCIFKGEFINFKKHKRIEKYIVLMAEFQINFFQNVDELFIDGTFKVAPKNWFQLLNIFGYEKKRILYAFSIYNSKFKK